MSSFIIIIRLCTTNTTIMYLVYHTSTTLINVLMSLWNMSIFRHKQFRYKLNWLAQRTITSFVLLTLSRYTKEHHTLVSFLKMLKCFISEKYLHSCHVYKILQISLFAGDRRPKFSCVAATVKNIRIICQATAKISELLAIFPISQTTCIKT